MDDYELLPGLRNPIFFGYNIVTDSYLGKRIFIESYEDGETLTYNNTLYKLPDGVNADDAIKTWNYFEYSLYDNIARYQLEVSSEVTADFKGVTNNAAVYTSVSFSNTLFSDLSKEYTFGSFIQQTYQAQRNDISGYITPDFAEALMALPSFYNSSSKNQFLDFFANYGTHFLKSGGFGGLVQMVVTVDKQLVEQTDNDTINTELKLGYKDIVNSGNMSASAAYEENNFISENAENIEIEILTIGGTYTGSTDTFIDYSQSVLNSPTPLLQSPWAKQSTTYVLLTDLLPDDTVDATERKSAFEKAVNDYMNSTYNKHLGIIAGPNPVDLNKVLKASSDAFLLGQLSCIDQSVEKLASIETGEDNSSLQKTGVGSGNNAGTNINPMQFPAIPYTTIGSQVPIDYYFYGSPNLDANSFAKYELASYGEASLLDAPREIPMNETFIPELDGIISGLVSIKDYSSDLSFGYIKICSGAKNSTGSETLAAGCVQIWNDNLESYKISKASFSLPVQKEVSYHFLKTENLDEDSKILFSSFIPGNIDDEEFEGIKIIKKEARESSRQYTAEHDGLITVFLSVPDSYTYGAVVTVKHGKTDDMVHQYKISADSCSSNNIPEASLMLPIPMGHQYQVDITYIGTNDQGSIVHNIYWHQLGAGWLSGDGAL